MSVFINYVLCFWIIFENYVGFVVCGIVRGVHPDNCVGYLPRSFFGTIFKRQHLKHGNGNQCTFRSCKIVPGSAT